MYLFPSFHMILEPPLFLKELRNLILQKGLIIYFDKITSRKLPDAYFDMKHHPRASKLQLKGVFYYLYSYWIQTLDYITWLFLIFMN